MEAMEWIVGKHWFFRCCVCEGDRFDRISRCRTKQHITFIIFEVFMPMAPVGTSPKIVFVVFERKSIPKKKTPFKTCSPQSSTAASKNAPP